MAVSALVAFQAQITETLASGVDGSASPSILHAAFDDSYSLSSSSTPPITKCVVKSVALSGGAATIHLGTITGTNGLAQDMSGLKVQIFRVKNTGTNAMTFTVGASEGYNLMGASMNFVLLSGQQLMFYGNDATPDVAAADRQIDVAGTGTETFELTILAG